MCVVISVIVKRSWLESDETRSHFVSQQLLSLLEDDLTKASASSLSIVAMVVQLLVC